MNTFAKLVTKLVAEQMGEESYHHDILHPAQYGGVEKKSTLDAALHLVHRVVEARERGYFTSALAVDISQFFPSLRHDVLVHTLRSQGFAKPIVNFIENWLKGCTTCYAMQSAQSEQFPFEVGVPQGNPLSPCLSVQYIAPILKKLFKFDLSSKTQSLFFVDNRVILVSSPSLHLNNSLLMEHFLQLQNEFLGIGLVLEASKTELMHFLHHELTRQGN